MTSLTAVQLSWAWNLTNSKAATTPASDVAYSREWAEENVQNKTKAQQIHPSRCVMHLPP
jgi:hypothetical protein